MHQIDENIVHSSQGYSYLYTAFYTLLRYVKKYISRFSILSMVQWFIKNGSRAY